MDHLPITPEIVQFFQKVDASSAQGVLEWETTADRATLLASLGDDFFVKLERKDDRGVADYVLSLMRSREVVFRIKPADLHSLTFGEALRVFDRIWEEAFRKAREISDDLRRASRLLDERLIAASAR